MSGVLNLLLAGAASAIKDAYYNLTTLLLNTSSTNGAQNNTFLDSSTNNFTITRNGNTTQGTFTPFSQTGWSNYFNGSNSYMTLGGAASLALSSGDFEISLWAYWNSVGTQVLYEGRPGSNGAYPVILTSSSVLIYFVNSANAITGPTVVANQWYYITVSRVSGTTKMFVNGSQVGSNYTDSTNYATGGTAPWIGAGYAPGDYMNGYISNLRVVVGSGVTSQTVPTTPLTAITNTKLLTCQSNRFVDSSASPLTITVNGTPSVQAFSPFAPTAAYDTAVVGGSGYFDGTGDYLTVPDTALLEPGTGDFTFETWVYHTVTNNQHTYTDQTGGGLAVYRQLNTNKVQVDADGNVAILTSTNTVPLNAWTHIAVARSGTTLRIFINGALDSSVTNSTNIAGTSAIGYGASPTGVNPMQGYMSSTRFTKGAALYTAAFTPPTAPFTTTVSSGTVNSLLNFTNAGIFDSTAKNALETVGNAQVSTTQAKWGTTSMYFDGTGDYLLGTNGINGDFGTGDFTIEFWMRASAAGSYVAVVATQSIFGDTTAGMWRCTNRLNSANGIYFNYSTGSSFINITFTTTNYNDDTWHHVAYARASGTLRAFVDGTQVGSNQTVTDSLTSGQKLIVANQLHDNAPYTGYIDDLRITKGYARYTANFTAPTAAFPLL